MSVVVAVALMLVAVVHMTSHIAAAIAYVIMLVFLLFLPPTTIFVKMPVITKKRDSPCSFSSGLQPGR